MGKKIKVVFDTNVWISIFMKKVLSEEFAQINEKIDVYISKDIILEISKVLMYPKIAEILRESRIHEKEILRAISANSKVVKPKLKFHVIEEDFEDNKILECALAAGADIIVTGDSHLLTLGKFKKTKILTPRQFLDYWNIK
ncbi:MAG: putative toxin-antitoxin system toxin component, PIN family [Candidatus Bathyarchaeia archaeon]